MPKYERAIKFAFEKNSGEVVEAEQVFDTKKNAFVTRRQFHRNEVELYCCECDQRLNVSSSKFERLHFKHEPNHSPCILTDGSLSPQEADEFNRIFVGKESPRHKELKHKIAARLGKVEGIDFNSIAVDNKFIFGSGGKRKPDVYCKYFGKEIIFEIQLSTLSLRYILNRHEFYKTKGMYLIWILDNFDVYSQSQMVKDIKYLTSYENFFKLDETAETFLLDCRYKEPFITRNNEVHTKWVNKSVGLHELSFDNNLYEAYFFNFKKEKSGREDELLEIIKQLKEQEKIELDTKRLRAAAEKAQFIIKTIKQFKNAKWENYERPKALISQLDDYETEIFNNELGIQKPRHAGNPAINQWIRAATKEDYCFLQFILFCEKITVPVNERSKDGRTTLQELYNNPQVLNKAYLAKALFTRGYDLADDDKAAIPNNSVTDDYAIFVTCSNIKDRSLVDFIFYKAPLLNIIESAKKGKMVGFNYKPTEWAAFAINAVQHYGKYWEYIELAFRKYGIWDKIFASDKKGTFQRKLQGLYAAMPEQSFDFDRVCRELYPEIFT